MTIAYLKNGANASANVNASGTAQRFSFVPSAGVVAYIYEIGLGILDDALFDGEYGNADLSIAIGPRFGTEPVGSTGAWSPYYSPIVTADDLKLKDLFELSTLGEQSMPFSHDITGSLATPINRFQSIVLKPFPFPVSRKGADNQQFSMYLSENYSALIEHAAYIKYFETEDFLRPVDLLPAIS